MNIYHKLLDLPEAETPPDHYGLLGVPRFTDDARVIHDALVSRNSQLKAWDNSKLYLEANTLLDEVVSASFILEDPIKKAVYDAELRKRLGIASPSPTALPATDAVSQEAPEWENLSELPKPARAKRPKAKVPTEKVASKSSVSRPPAVTLGLMAIVSAAVIVVAVGVVMMLSNRSPNGPSAMQTVASTDAAPTKSNTTGDISQTFSPQITDRPNDKAPASSVKSFTGHQAEVFSAAVSPVDRIVASAGRGGDVVLWDADTGERVNVLKGNANSDARAVLFSPDGQYLISSAGRIKLWELPDGRELLEFGKTAEGATTYYSAISAALSPDGNLLATGGSDRAIRLWNAKTGQLRDTIPAHADNVYALSFSPAGAWLASGSGDKTIKLWNVQTKELERTLTGHTGSIHALAFAADEKTFASSSMDATVRIWNIGADPPATQFTIPHQTPFALAFAPDGRTLAMGSGDTTVKLWDAQTGKLLKVMSGHSGPVASVTFSRDGQSLVSGSWDKTVRLWQVSMIDATPAASTATAVPTPPAARSPQPALRLSPIPGVTLRAGERMRVKVQVERRECQGPVVVQADAGASGLTFNPLTIDADQDSGQLECLAAANAPTVEHRIVVEASLGSLRSTRLVGFNVASAEIHSFKGHSKRIRCVALSPDGDYVLSGSDDRTMRLWDSKTGAELRQFPGHTGEVASVAFSPDGRNALSGSYDRVRLWDVETGRELRSLGKHDREVSCVVFSADGRQALSGSHDQTFRLWDTQTGQELRRFGGDLNIVFCVAPFADGSRVLLGCGDTLRLWNLKTGREQFRFQGHSKLVCSVGVSADGLRAISSSYDETIRLWDAKTGRELRRLQGHNGIVESVILSADGRRALSGGQDNTVRLWDAETGRELARLQGHRSALSSVALSVDGRRAVSGGYDETVRLWQLPEEAEPSAMSATPMPATAVTAAAVPSPSVASPALAEGKLAGEEWDGNGLKMKLCWCPSATFTMGSPLSEVGRQSDEKQVAVTLARGFWMAKFEVTQAEYSRLIGTNPSYSQAAGLGKNTVAGLDTSLFAVEQVSWDDAMSFCQKLTAQERSAGRLPAGWEYRLPTEAQWEYACRAGTTTAYALGSTLSVSDANVSDANNSGGRQPKVGAGRANAWGIYDMHGNVLEWCRDVYSAKLVGGTARERTTGGTDRVVRGGSRCSDASDARSAHRDHFTPTHRNSCFGFRVVCVPVPKTP